MYQLPAILIISVIDIFNVILAWGIFVLKYLIVCNSCRNTVIFNKFEPCVLECVIITSARGY